MTTECMLKSHRRLWKKDNRQLDGEEKLAVGAIQPEDKVDASKCPNCFGTGMYFPEWFDKASPGAGTKSSERLIKVSSMPDGHRDLLGEEKSFDKSSPV
jgi:hypothetical protein